MNNFNNAFIMIHPINNKMRVTYSIKVFKPLIHYTYMDACK